MSPLARRCLAVLFYALLLPASVGAQEVFSDSFEMPFWKPESDAEAARFLNQATFGATPATISQLRTGGLEAFVQQQVAAAPTLSRPFLETLAVSENAAAVSLAQNHRVQRWVDTAVTAPDQLRQRVAWALGQMVVVSDQDAGLSDEPIMVAEWNDLLVRNAFGNFRTLLAETVRSPMMGRYLTHLRNRKFEITPRCYDQRPSGTPPVLDHNLGGNPPYHDCTGNDATNNGTLPVRIALYRLPPGGLVAPDENFAREIMQLFTIGLVERNIDFSPDMSNIDPSTGLPFPTYNQGTVTTLSRVLTGLSYACSGPRTVAGQLIARNCNCGGTDCSFQTGNFFSTPPSLTLNEQGGLVHPDRYEPMICYPRYHDTGRDRQGFQLPGVPASNPANGVIAGGVVIDIAPSFPIPGGTPGASKVVELGGAPALTLAEVDPGLARGTAVNCDALGTGSSAADKAKCLGYCNSSIDAAIDMLFNEPNTATMIGRQLIQRLVSSNPSPQYIERVAGVFRDNGVGVRGDLRAVVKAVLFDPEARQAPGAPGTAVDAGKPREPLLKMVQLWRSFGAVSGDASANGYRRWARFASGCSSSSWPQCAYQQRPIGAPSVFNFYEPDYKVPGDIADLGLVSPEFQIINESSSILAANDIYNQLCTHRGTGSNSNCHGPLRASPPTGMAHFPDAALDALPGGNCGAACSAADDAALIEALNVRLLGGSMTGTLGNLANPADTTLNTGMKGVLLRLLQIALNTNPPTAGGFVEAIPQNVRRREILYLLHLVAISPEYATQR
jgi:uncharacterized protein (DUF1800 family)